jgi:hypothetical protein
MPAIDWIQSCWVGAFVLLGFGHGSVFRSLESSRLKTVVNNLSAISRSGLDQGSRIGWQRQKYSINLMIDGWPGRYNGDEMVQSYER